ncbi:MULTISPECIES: M48 family metallopeptidase [unclassified Streptomyces]|uniref:M48 metallopeptidase family protein n=1 Tax=Streptomycetaceae TaxID=2062 RepID=UPI002E776FA2|nr:MULTISPECIES: M48 family metallopeptidase [unclassified Streptomyces]MED7954493.1 M48 family metallopeptidase [Streptomyces sp. BE303]MEE1826966.1 M48 family metallopeptidase [Streptomyces sp. BE20]
MAAERDSHPQASPRRARAASGSQVAAPSTRGRPEQQPGAARSEPFDRSRVEVRRSARRSRTVSAYREGDRTIVLIPARMSHAEEQRWVAQMLEKLAAQESRRVLGDDALVARARELSAAYLDDRAEPAQVRWVTNQNSRWGSCTPSERTIRLSHRLQGMPEYVVDYVLLHELAHLLVPDHGPAFWALLEAYPRTERARGYLEGVVSAARLPHIPGARHAGPPDSEPAGSCG